MVAVKVSPKYQIVIPKEIRKEMPLKSGQKVELIVKDGMISIVPDKPLSSFRGYLKGVSLKNLRERRDRW